MEKLDQQNEGRNAKPARFVFRLVARAQSADRVYANQRTSERTNQQRTKQQTTARKNEHENHAKMALRTLLGRSRDGPGKLKIEQKSIRSALGATFGDPGALGALPERSRTALGRARDGPRTLWGRPWDGLRRSREVLRGLPDGLASARGEFFARP